MTALQVILIATYCNIFYEKWSDVDQHVITRRIIYHLHTQAQAHGIGHNVQPVAVAVPLHFGH